MRIECPGCAATYEVPEAQIRPGRRVRCVHCTVQWQPAGQSSVEAVGQAGAERLLEAEGVPPDPPASGGIARLRRPSAPAAGGVRVVAPLPATEIGMHVRLAMLLQRQNLPMFLRRKKWELGWAASLIVLAVLLSASVHWRMAIMQAWPPSVRLYVALGAQPPGLRPPGLQSPRFQPPHT